ncbi:MAG: serine/threonine-protein kinase [Pirellulaceae bacterium]
MTQSSLEVSYTDITEVYLEELRRGNRVSPQALAKRFPQYANRILSELPLMEALERDLGKKEASVPNIPGYQLVSEIGRGAYGIVYKAKHDSGKPVAIKLVCLDGELPNLARLDREIESLKRLKHPNIVTIDGFGTTQDYVYIVTNLVEGITFAELLDSQKSYQANYWAAELHNEWNHLAAWGLEIASALEFIHQNKVIHRDIKPSNLLIDQSGKCWIIDFGLAKICEVGMTLTQSRQIAGTPRFMAPEQLRGIVDVRCDIYSFGRTLYELACCDADINQNSANLQSVSVLNPSMPPELAKIIDKACDPAPDRRYQTASEMVAVLTRYLEGRSPCDRRRLGKRMSEQEFKARMRHRVRYALAGCALCCVGAVAAVVVPRFKSSPIYNPASIAHANENNDSLKLLASAIDDQESGFVEVIGEAMKHSVVNQSNDKVAAAEVASKIDRIVDKVKTEGLKPGELDSLMTNYRGSTLMNASKVGALHHPLHNSTLSPEEKMRGHKVLELFSKAVINKRIQGDSADHMLASLFQGEIPKLEQIVSMRIPDEALQSWLRLVESSFGKELEATATETSQSNQELKRIIDGFFEQAR